MNYEIKKSGVITIILLLQNRKQHENEDGSARGTPCPNGDILTEMLMIALLTDFPVVGLNLKTWIRT